MGKPNGLVAVLLAGMLSACAAPAPRGTVGQPDPGGVPDARLGAGYGSEGSGQSPAEPWAAGSEQARTRPEPGQDNPEPTGQSDRTRTAMEGALVGALIGGLAGGFGFGGVETALIGAALGAGAGFLIADQIAKRKEQYASEEEFLDSELQMAADFNRSAAAYNEQLRGEIAALNRSVDELLLQYNDGLVTISAIDERRVAIQQKIEEADKVREDLIEEYEIKLAVYDEQKEKRAQTDAYLVSLAKELNQLDQNIQSLKNGSLELAQIEDKLTV